MGLPDDNPDGYRDGSPITFAERPARATCSLIHGTGDDNCHYQSCERLVDELDRRQQAVLDAGLSQPDPRHSSEGKNTTRHLYELLTRFLEDKTPPYARAR